MSDIILQVENLAKRFGRVEAVKNVSFSVRRAAITAFLGENGAGKTTTIKAILGFIKPNAGRLETRCRQPGYVPEHPVFFPWLKGREILGFTAKLFGVDKGNLARIVDRISAAVVFDQALLERRVQTYSLGNQKKFSYLQSLIVSPDFLIVDEPFSGLDPVSIKSVRELFRRLKAEGKTLFLSSHLISEMEKISDDVIIIKKGSILLRESWDHLRKNFILASLERAWADAGEMSFSQFYHTENGWATKLLLPRNYLEELKKCPGCLEWKEILNLETFFLFFAG